MEPSASTQAPAAPQPGAVFTLMPDELTLHLVASGLIALAQQARERAALTLPYPPSLQRGLNRLVLTCLRRDRRPPQKL